MSETIVESGSSMVVQHGLYAALKSEMQWKRDGRRESCEGRGRSQKVNHE